MLLVPPGLLLQWRDELRGKFRREAVIVDGALARRDPDVWAREPLILVSSALARREPHAERIAEAGFDVVGGEIRSRLAGFCAASLRRLEAEKERIVAYHDRLVLEAGGRRGAAAETIAAKRAAIRRTRRERLDELAERHAVESSFWLASALVVRYEVGMCRVRRRRRELSVSLEWDPFLKDFIGPPCAAACAECARVSCKRCRPKGCGCAS